MGRPRFAVIWPGWLPHVGLSHSPLYTARCVTRAATKHELLAFNVLKLRSLLPNPGDA